MQRFAALFVCAIFVCALTAVGAAQIVSVAKPPTPEMVAARRAELQRLLDAYASGDHAIVRRSFGLRLDPTTRAALEQLLNDPAAPWQPARAAFTLEVAVALRRVGDFSGTSLLRAGRKQVLGRPGLIGANAAEDRLEVLFHQTALGVLQGLGDWGGHGEYLDIISPRIVRMAQTSPPIANRFALARGLGVAMKCCAHEIMPDQLVLIVNRGGTPPRTPPPPSAAQALAFYDAAASDPALKSEAMVRKAHLEQILGHPSQSQAALDQAGSIADVTLAYAAALIRGGNNDRLERPEDAVTAYAEALRLAPDSQVPAIGHAAALQRSGRTDEAVAAADRAYRYAGNDPWPTFIRADARYVETWLAEIRTLVK